MLRGANKVTNPQNRALQILSENRIERPGQFARLMWPDAEGWARTTKCGAYGVCRGGGMRMAAGGYLGRLRKAGLVKNGWSEAGQRIFTLTDAGQAAMREGNAQDQNTQDVEEKAR